MSARDPIARLGTHEVTNQPPVFEGHNLYDGDPALAAALAREGAGWAESQVRALGALAGDERIIQLGRAANRHGPELRTFDAFGRRIDEVEFHPAYHELMGLAAAHQVHSIAWTAGRPGGHVAHTALEYLLTQAEAGVCCPITMTYAAIPTLRRQPEIAAEWQPRVLSSAYDPRCIPAAEKTAATIGMAMTEKQGGSDVRANTSRAEAAGAGGPGAEYRLRGHKWFCSAPMSDAFLTLAYAEKGLSCFLVPRWRPDGTRNAFLIRRLKDKLGNRSNASAEVEFHEAYATLLGEEGRGVPMILEMGVYTRLDCAIGSAGLMRQALSQALWHAAQRTAFGRLLCEQPLMKNVLADLALESEAATALALRLSRAYDAQVEERERLLARVLTPTSKFWICKRGAHFAEEAMEAIGGNGYVEENALARIYREMPVNSIWEGSGNIMCLDVLRALRKAPEVLAAVASELDAAGGRSASYDRFCAALKDRLADAAANEAGARALTQDLALAVQASLLARHAPQFVFEAFCASRLERGLGGAFGTLARYAPLDALIERAMPSSPSQGEAGGGVPG